MPVQVACPKCRKPLSIGDDLAGRALRCPACGASFRTTPSGDSGAKRAPAGPESAPRGVGGAKLPDAIGPFQVRAELGRGAFGVVYRAHDAQLGRDVAIKVLNRDALASAKAVERFLREARVVAQMHHNSIVPVFLLGQHDGAHYIASKFIAGRPLSEAIPDEGMEPGQAVELVIQLLEALAYAHDMDVLHRDVKPANAILDERGKLYLMDFGLAGWVGQETGRMTQDGSVMGTPSFMAPEQARGDIRNVGPAADQYSAGVVLYELLTGHLPFEGGPMQALIYNVINTDPPPPSEWRKDLDPRLETICLTAMAKVPENRHPSCRDFADALRVWRGESSVLPEVLPVEEAPAAPPRRGDTVKRKTPPTEKRTVPIPPTPVKKTTAAPPPSKRREVSRVLPPPRRSRRGCLAVLLIGGFLAALVVAIAYLVFDQAGTSETKPDAPRSTAGGFLRDRNK